MFDTRSLSECFALVDAFDLKAASSKRAMTSQRSQAASVKLKTHLFDDLNLQTILEPAPRTTNLAGTKGRQVDTDTPVLPTRHAPPLSLPRRSEADRFLDTTVPAVIATLGPSCRDYEVLVEMLQAGMSCARIDLTVRFARSHLVQRTTHPAHEGPVIM